MDGFPMYLPPLGHLHCILKRQQSRVQHIVRGVRDS